MKRAVAVLLAALVVLTGCSTSKDAVAIGGGTFQFVAPNGQVVITYDNPASRETVGSVSGPSLLRAGQTVGLADFAGKIVVINVWGSWCGLCRTEAPDLEFVQEQTAPLGAAVLGIDVKDERQAATDFVQDRGLTYDSIFDVSGRSLVGLGGLPRNVVPLTIVLDKQHRVAAVYLMPIRVTTLLPVIQRLAAEPAPVGVPG